MIPAVWSGPTPGGYELALNPYNGGAGNHIIFDINGDGLFNNQDNVANLPVGENFVTGVRFDAAIPTDATFFDRRRFTQEADKIRQFKTLY